jgi:hypothetical protein
VDDVRHVAGGYFLEHPGANGKAFDRSPLLPSRVVSLSGCIADFALNSWWNTETAAAALDFGVQPDQLPDLVEWYRERFEQDLGFPAIAFSRSVLEDFVAEFVNDSGELRLIGCALPDMYRDRFLASEATLRGSGRHGVYEMVERNETLEEGAWVLGYEPISCQHGLGCSWLCNGLHTEAATSLGLRPDLSTGLLSTLDEASRVIALIEDGTLAAEPGPWLPWQILAYRLEG